MLDPIAVAKIVAGTWHGAPPAAWGRLNFDSRKFAQGEIFLALQGKRDGHDFIAAAQAAGAIAAVVDRVLDCGLPQLVVKDSLAALHKLAAQQRATYQGEVVLITGSNGKSTTKEMLASILASWVGNAVVLASRGNLNNHLGLPLSMLDLQPQHEYAVLEAGMSHAGEITELAQLAQPRCGIITNAGRAHLGNFASADGIAKAKGELIECLPKHGTIVLNADDQNYELWCGMAKHNEVISFSHAGCQGSICRRLQDRDFIFAFDGTSQPLEVTLQVGGKHNEENALAAATMAWFLGAPTHSIVEGLEEFTGVPGRQQVYMLRDMVLIDDTYNSSPESLSAAIVALVERPEEEKVLIIGDMLELGEQSETEHRQAVQTAFEQGVHYVLGIGEATKVAIEQAGEPAKHFASKQELVDCARQLACGSVVMLVKGSRGMHMEEVVTGLLQG